MAFLVLRVHLAVREHKEREEKKVSVINNNDIDIIRNCIYEYLCEGSEGKKGEIGPRGETGGKGNLYIKQ